MTEKYLKNRDGFTLVELAVVMMLMSILFGVSLFGLTAWHESEAFNRQEETARLLFGTVQNRLVQYESNGILQEVCEPFQGTETLKVNGLVDKVYENIDDEVCSIIIMPGDYNAYCENNWIGYSDYESTVISFFFNMIDDRIYDKTVLSEGVICLEFSPITGQVYGILYSDRDTGFVYDRSCSGLSGEVVDISCRDQDYRRQRQTGYYGIS